MSGEGDLVTGGDLYAVSHNISIIFKPKKVFPVSFVSRIFFCPNLLVSLLIYVQTVFENSLVEHHVALPPDAMGKITFVAPPGQYSLKVFLLHFFYNLEHAFLVLSSCSYSK